MDNIFIKYNIYRNINYTYEVNTVMFLKIVKITCLLYFKKFRFILIIQKSHAFCILKF